MTQGAISLLISAFGAFISLFALYFVVVQIRLLREQIAHAKDVYDADQVRARRHATLEYLSSTLDRRLSLIYSMPSLDDVEAVDEFLAAIHQDVQARNALHSFLGAHESIAAGVNMGVLDEHVVQRTIGYTMMAAYARFSGYMTVRREKTGNPNLYAELEALSQRLQQAASDRHAA